MRQKAKKWIKIFSPSNVVDIKQHHWLLISGSVVGLFIGFLAWTTFAPQTIAYNYGLKQTCVTSPRLLPSMSTAQGSNQLAISRPARVSIGSFALYANSICAKAVEQPKQNYTYNYQEKFLGWVVLSKHIAITAPDYPKLARQTTKVQQVAPNQPLLLQLQSPDRTFSYSLMQGGVSAPCTMQATNLACDLKPLGLQYASVYDLAVARSYKKQSGLALATIPIQTITPTTIVASSITANANVQSKPTELTIATDKTLQSIGGVTLVSKQADGNETPIPLTASFSEKTIHVKLGAELARKVNFELRLSSLQATDSSGLVGESYTLPFSTSGGPRVTSANIGSRNVAQAQNIVLNFDQPLLATQDLQKLVTFRVGGAAAAATMSISDNKLTIHPTTALPFCTAFTVSLSNDFQNLYGIMGDSAWNISSRSICYTTFSIGSSVRGRAITAYKFGTGPSLIVFIGAMHGNESNTKKLMTEWINELIAHPERVPANRTIVVIPSANPDGVASDSRLNANGVDLNRNFPANDWKSNVTLPDNSQPTPAGGPYPLSEPESSAIAGYLRQTRPRLTLSYHSKASIVEANEAGDSVYIASIYASKAGYRAVPKSQSGSVFQYDTTGAMEDWLRDAYGDPALVIELASSTSSEFSRNKNALWYIAGL